MPDSYDRIRSLPLSAVVEILEIDLSKFKTRKGGELYGPCPVHRPKNNTTSFSYALDGRFHCFSCSAKGKGAIDLVKVVKQIGFQQAVELLKNVQAPELPIQQKSASIGDSEGVERVLKPLEKDTWRKFQVPCPWLEERIPDAGVRGKYGVFCYNNPARKSAYSGRVMIPIKAGDSTLFGYLGRNIHTSQQNQVGEKGKQEPKYLFPPNFAKSQFLFGAAEIAGGMFGPAPLPFVVIAESPFCCLKYAMWNVPCVSPFGWSLSAEQIEILATLTTAAYYLPDRNKSGQESAATVQSLAKRMWVTAPDLPNGKDDPEWLEESELRAILPIG